MKVIELGYSDYEDKLKELKLVSVGGMHHNTLKEAKADLKRIKEDENFPVGINIEYCIVHSFSWFGGYFVCATENYGWMVAIQRNINSLYNLKCDFNKHLKVLNEIGEKLNTCESELLSNFTKLKETKCSIKDGGETL